MAYCTRTDIELLIGKEPLKYLSDDEGQNATNNSTLARSIEVADTIIDSYLAERYALPFSPVPALIVQISSNLAVCELYAHRHPDNVPKAIEARRATWMKQLERIASGDTALKDATAAGPASDGGTTRVNDRTRVITQDLLDQY